MDELVDQARLPDSSLPHHGHGLALARPGPLQCVGEGLKLGLPSHKAGEPAGSAGLQTLVESTHPDQRKDLHGVAQRFLQKRPETLDGRALTYYTRSFWGDNPLQGASYTRSWPRSHRIMKSVLSVVAQP